jgi:phosphopentomutase
MRVGRVIARPFVGSPEAGFTRTTNRHDYAIETPAPTLLDWVQAAGGRTWALGKISDIFSGRGVDEVRKGSDAALFDHLLDVAEKAADGDLVFANFVEFDSEYGHRRDVAGYARALEWFDARLPEFLARLRPGDIALFTADHGNDPTWTGTEHTRERVPVLLAGAGTGRIGLCAFADVAASLAAHLGVTPGPHGTSFLP